MSQPAHESADAKSAHVVILMATHNGADHLADQLGSFLAQDHADWSLIVSDDGSDDGTPDILAAFTKAHPDRRVTLLSGPCKGADANFMSLLRHSADAAPAGSFIAFSDQDDVWLPQRLSRGVAALAGLSDHRAAWCSRTIITGAEITGAGMAPRLSGDRLSAPRPRPLGFRNALVQNVMAGNTILLNSAAATWACRLAEQVDRVVVHDWWLYLILTGSGATVVHDDRPSLYYRQHAKNQIGANDSYLARLKRLKALVSGRSRDWNEVNLAALQQASPDLTAENTALIDLFEKARRGPLHRRLIALRQARLYRQTRISTAAIWFAVIFGLF
jgi:glycosyltransferase involved in cell wall biosynthesis